MRNDRVLIVVLHVANDAKCFSPCVHSYFHQQLLDKFFHHKNANVWVEGV